MLFYTFRRAFGLFMKSLNSNFGFISLACISFCYLFSLALSTLGETLALNFDTVKSSTEKDTHNINLVYPFALVGASKFFKINTISHFLYSYKNYFLGWGEKYLWSYGLNTWVNSNFKRPVYHRQTSF